MTEAHFCNQHATKFFKTAKMRGYAHPIEDKDGKTTGWCNEEDQESYHDPNPKKDTPPQQEHQPVPVTAIAPQAVGMMTKEIGDMIRAKMLTVIYGTKIANELTKWYRSQALGITRINYDGKDLPVFK